MNLCFNSSNKRPRTWKHLVQIPVTGNKWSQHGHRQCLYLKWFPINNLLCSRGLTIRWTKWCHHLSQPHMLLSRPKNTVGIMVCKEATPGPKVPFAKEGCLWLQLNMPTAEAICPSWAWYRPHPQETSQCRDVYSECRRACPDCGTSAHLTVCLQPHIINPLYITGWQMGSSMFIPFASIKPEHQGGFTVTH